MPGAAEAEAGPAQTPRSPLLARRLAASGDYTGDVRTTQDTAYAAELQEAVKRFQRRHGLDRRRGRQRRHRRAR